jgi:Helix-turn-helix domain
MTLFPFCHRYGDFPRSIFGRGFKNLTMKDQKPEEIWIDKQEIMMRLHISNRTLQTWRSKGILPFARIGKKIFYKESDLRNLLNAHVRQDSKTVQSRAQYGNST